MDIVAGLAYGFTVLLSPSVQIACVLGLVGGVAAGFLPGISPAGALALAASLLGAVLVSFGVQSPVVFAVAFAYGTLYGRALAAINFNASAAADAGPYPKSERPVLAAALLASIVIAAAAGIFVAAGGAGFALSLGPIEIAALVVFLLLGGAAFGRGSTASALAMVVLGLLFGLVGTDLETGIPRLTFGITALEDGLGVLEVALGLFVIANVIDDLVRAMTPRQPTAAASDRPVRDLWPSMILAVLAGFLPTNGATFATTVGARRARPAADLFDPASQNSVSGIIRAAILSDIRLSVSLIVLLLLYIPSDVVTVLLRDAVYGQAMLTKATVDPTPIVWIVCATLIVAHIVPLIIVTRLATARWRPIPIDVRIVGPLLIAACCFLTSQMHESVLTGLGIMFAFGLIGYAMIRAGFDRSLMFFAFAVGLALEENIRRSMLIARGDVTVFLQRPISATFLLAGVALLVAVRTWRRRCSQAAAQK
jgi:putative tricarboxylic transport membrane protein